ncbi:Nucleotide-diphospho-sugar transferase [Gracilaria domingensis]|nr:Nucleotide-diphospho-sugar transferase [Gracilaria domingensis]
MSAPQPMHRTLQAENMLKPYAQRSFLVVKKTNVLILLSLAASVAILNITIRRMFRTRRDLIIKERLAHMRRSGLSEHPSAALITLSDPSFQDCMLQLFRKARHIGWKEPMFLLAIDYDFFEEETRQEIEELGVFVVRTRPIFDSWIDEMTESQKSYRHLEPNKFRKMEVFLNPVFRTYERLIFLDADGLLTSLEPMLRVMFPDNVTILMRQNDRSFNKKSLHGNEINRKYLDANQTRQLDNRYPDRAKTGATCFFIVDVEKLPSPVEIFSRSIEIICTFRPGFRLNDQTLLNLLFYNELSLFPHCSWDEIVAMDDSRRLLQYCKENMRLQRWLLGHLSFAYRHMAVTEKKKHLREWERKNKAESNETLVGDSIDSVEASYFETKTFSSCHDAASAWRERFLTLES